jgi:hypothetical protein
MPERDSKSTPAAADWSEQWLEQQREALRRAAGHNASENKAGSASAADSSTASSAPPRSFEDLLNSWRGAWSSAAGAQPASATQFADLLGQTPAIGPLREHTETWRAIAAAQAEYQKLEQELRAVMMGVQSDALDLVQERLRERNAGAQPIKDFRELHKLWVECGERVFAKVAHSDAYCKLQAELGNALTRLRAQQQKVIEHALKQFDLPTRSELNTVHRQLRDQKAQLRAHKELLAKFVDRMKAPPATRKAPAKSKKKAPRTSR